MKRDRIKVSIGTFWDHSLSTLEEFIKTLNDLYKDNSSKYKEIRACLESQYIGGDEEYALEVYGYRLENDKELEARKNKENKEKEYRRQQYEKLKEEFEK